jgi:HAE1 family hydrophobic/amphiphilic exporter-1
MNVSRIFIERPVLTTLLMAALVIFGLFGYSTLPVSELPAVDFPTIQVSASLPGADPQTMASAVATPLESQFSSIAGVASMTSQSSAGRTNITIQFDLDRDIDGASEDVQAAIQAASRQLPVNMPSPPTLRKVNPADAPILYLSLQSDSIPLYELDRYAENLLARQISTLSRSMCRVRRFLPSGCRSIRPSWRPATSASIRWPPRSSKPMSMSPPGS